LAVNNKVVENIFINDLLEIFSANKLGVKIHKNQIILSIILFFLSIFLYLFFHGTENLIIIDTVNKIFPLIPVVPGIKITTSIINGYLVDILWFTSLISLSSLFLPFSRLINSIVAFVFGSTLEILQLLFSVLGTFDYYDILCYFGIFILYNLFVFIRKKRRNN
jgi:hypothetical protein